MINNSFVLAPWANVLYFADHRWWEWYIRDGRATLGFSADEVKAIWRDFAGQKCMIENSGKKVPEPDIFVLKNAGPGALSEKPNAICTGSNSGYQSVNIAWLAGAKRIILLGLDMSFPGGRAHNHDGHPRNQSEPSYKKWGEYFARMKPQLEATGTEVINCSTGQGIKAFPFRGLESVLDDPA